MQPSLYQSKHVILLFFGEAKDNGHFVRRFRNEQRLPTLALQYEKLSLCGIQEQPMSMLKPDRDHVLKSAAARVCLPHCIRMSTILPQFQLFVLIVFLVLVLLLLHLCYNADDTVHNHHKYG